MTSKRLFSLEREFQLLANPIRAQSLQKYFRTGKGEYGEGDRFLGTTVPALRRLVKIYRTLAWGEIRSLLMSPWHEKRLLALLILGDQFVRGDQSLRDKIFHRYLQHTHFVNNWDLLTFV